MHLFVLLPNFIKKGIIHKYVSQKQKELINRNGPDILYFFVTNRCNMRCKHCFYLSKINDSAREELSANEIKKIASSLKNCSSSVCFTGGEPFLRNDLAEIVADFIEKGNISSLSIPTNGFFTDRIVKTIKHLLGKYPKVKINVQISLDGPEHIHDAIRNTKGAYRNACQTISELEEISKENKNSNITINTVVSEYNAPEFEVFYRNVLEKYKVNIMWHFARQDEHDVHGIAAEELLCFNGLENFKNLQNRDLLPDENTCRDLIELIEKYEGNNLLSKWRMLLKSYHIQISKEDRKAVNCIAPFKGGVLFPDGGVSICEVLKSAANVKDFNFDYSSCWKSQAIEKQRKKANFCFCTYPCYLMDSMLFDEGSILQVIQ